MFMKFGSKIQNDKAVPEPTINQEPQIVEYKEPGFVETVNNRIYFYADIEREKMLMFIKTLKDKGDEMIARKLTWNLEEVPPIHIHIQSYGGWAHAGFSGFDHISSMKYRWSPELEVDIPIYTYVDGVAASAATLLVIGGTKRFIQRNGFMMIHQIRTDYWGTYTHEEMKDHQKNNENLMAALKRLYLERTKIPEKTLDELLTRDLYFTAEECVEYGLVDSII